MIQPALAEVVLWTGAGASSAPNGGMTVRLLRRWWNLLKQAHIETTGGLGCDSVISGDALHVDTLAQTRAALASPQVYHRASIRDANDSLRRVDRAVLSRSPDGESAHGRTRDGSRRVDVTRSGLRPAPLKERPVTKSPASRGVGSNWAVWPRGLLFPSDARGNPLARRLAIQRRPLHRAAATVVARQRESRQTLAGGQERSRACSNLAACRQRQRSGTVNAASRLASAANRDLIEEVQAKNRAPSSWRLGGTQPRSTAPRNSVGSINQPPAVSAAARFQRSIPTRL